MVYHDTINNTNTTTAHFPPQAALPIFGALKCEKLTELSQSKL